MLRLVRSETRVRDEVASQEVTEESTYSEFKTVVGTQQAMKIVLKRNGKPRAEFELEEVKPSKNSMTACLLAPESNESAFGASLFKFTR